MTAQPLAYAQPAPNGLPARSALGGLSFLVHARSKAGKSALGDTTPAPRLVLDAEGGSRFTLSRKREWNPAREPLPALGQRMTAGYGRPSITPEWESLIVYVREARQVGEAYRILNSGHHPFNSTVFDSVTEVQQRVIDDLTGGKSMDRDKWGSLLRQMNVMARQFRDLITHPVKPMWSVFFIAGTHMDSRTGRWRPLLQGQTSEYMPYYVDLLGYLGAGQDGTRHLLVGPHPQYETGERVGGRLPPAMVLANPYLLPARPGFTVSSMIQQVLS